MTLQPAEYFSVLCGCVVLCVGVPHLFPPALRSPDSRVALAIEAHVTFMPVGDAMLCLYLSSYDRERSQSSLHPGCCAAQNDHMFCKMIT